MKSAQTTPQAPLLWIGDNIGADSLTIIEALAPMKTLYMSIEEALCRIEDFAEPGRSRILASLPLNRKGSP